MLLRAQAVAPRGRHSYFRDPSRRDSVHGVGAAAGADSGGLFAKGRNGQITVSDDWLMIERKGLGRLGHSKGDRRIPLATITAVQMRPAGPLANGFLKFSVPGSPELRGGLQAATKEENAVIVTRKHQAEFDAVRARVEEYLATNTHGHLLH